MVRDQPLDTGLNPALHILGICNCHSGPYARRQEHAIECGIAAKTTADASIPRRSALWSPARWSWPSGEATIHHTSWGLVRIDIIGVRIGNDCGDRGGLPASAGPLLRWRFAADGAPLPPTFSWIQRRHRREMHFAKRSHSVLNGNDDSENTVANCSRGRTLTLKTLNPQLLFAAKKQNIFHLYNYFNYYYSYQYNYHYLN